MSEKPWIGEMSAEERSLRVRRGYWDARGRFPGPFPGEIAAGQIITNAIRDAEQRAAARAREEAARRVETYFPKIHTMASENTDRYLVQDETCEVLAAAIRALK